MGVLFNLVMNTSLANHPVGTILGHTGYQRNGVF